MNSFQRALPLTELNLKLVKLLIHNLDKPSHCSDVILKNACPVISFGDYKTARVATVGLNPSDKEFICDAGKELTGNSRRFHTLKSLSLTNWSSASLEDLQDIDSQCVNYFRNNPYSRWFNPLNELISGTGCSYYSSENSACHLDLVPYATNEKWGSLALAKKNQLIDMCSAMFLQILASSNVSVLVLNGKSVIEGFQKLLNVELIEKRNRSWDLNRETGNVSGYSYEGSIILKGQNNSNILILGYNYNIQSSFGITNSAKIAIKKWITKKARQHLEQRQ